MINFELRFLTVKVNIINCLSSSDENSVSIKVAQIEELPIDLSKMKNKVIVS